MMDLVSSVEVPDVGNLQLWNAKRIDYLMPSQEITGSVKFSTTKPLLIRGVWVKLIGSNKLKAGEHFNDPVHSIDLLIGEEDHYLGGIHDVLFGFGEEEENNRSNTAMLELTIGAHEWNYSFTIPSNAPYSYCDKCVEVLYTVTAYVDIPEVPSALSQVTQMIIIGCASKSQASRGAVRESLCLGDTPMGILSVKPLPFLSRIMPSAMRGCDQSMRVRLTIPLGGIPQNASFKFEYTRAFLKVRCHLEIERKSKPLRMVVRLLACVNTRKDVSKPFQSLQSLLSAHDNCSQSPRKRKGFFNKKPDMERSTCHTIWKKTLMIASPCKHSRVDIDVPISIDPTFRASCLSEWPNAVPIPHDSSNSILFFTAGGPLFEYKVILAVTIHEGLSPELLPPCIGEILIRPPTPLRLDSTPVRQPMIVYRRTPSEVDRLHPQSFQFHSDERGRAHQGLRTSHITPTCPSQIICQDRGISATRLTPLIADNAIVPLRNVSRSTAVTALISDENVPPIGSQQGSVNRPMCSNPKVVAPSTPHAKRALPKVMGEAVSRGPAAALQDRTNGQHRSVQITPSRYAPAYTVSTGAVVMMALPPSMSSPPPPYGADDYLEEYSPAMAFVCVESTVCPTDQNSDNNNDSAATSPPVSVSSRFGGSRDGNVRRLSFSTVSGVASPIIGPDDVEDLSNTSFSAYHQSPPPLVMTSRPHSHSASSLRPLVMSI